MLIHGNSRVTRALVLKAAKSKQFNVIVTEGRPGGDGVEAARAFIKAGIPTRMVLDSAVASVIDQVDMCLCGAEGVMENGGIVNKTGTYQVAIVAKALNKPFYVAVESYKFARMYPLTQRDIVEMCRIGEDSEGVEDSPEGQAVANGELSDLDITIRADIHSSSMPLDNTAVSSGPDRSSTSPDRIGRSNSGENLVVQKMDRNSSSVDISLLTNDAEDEMGKVQFDHTLIDYTPAHYITLLFTDLGVLTPAAVSDELIRLYQ